jgi:Na+/proline symporter
VAAIEAKVKAGAAGGTLVGLISWLLVAFVPAFHNGLPPAVAALLPVVLGVVASTVSGYMAPHTPRPADPVAVPVTAVPPV